MSVPGVMTAATMKMIRMAYLVWRSRKPRRHHAHLREEEHDRRHLEDDAHAEQHLRCTGENASEIFGMNVRSGVLKLAKNFHVHGNAM